MVGTKGTMATGVPVSRLAWLLELTAVGTAMAASVFYAVALWGIRTTGVLSSGTCAFVINAAHPLEGMRRMGPALERASGSLKFIRKKPG